MLIVGAGGLAAQVFDELVALKAQDIVFWSEVETKYPFIKEKFNIINNDEMIIDYFNNVSKSFILCISGLEARKKMVEKFTKLGGTITSYLSPFSTISTYSSTGNGTVILSRVEIEACVSIGEKCLINKTANIGHGCIIGSNCEISPGVIFLGEVELGENSYVGASTTVFPKVKIGKNVTISVGSIIKKNVPDNAVVSGDFATVKFYRK